MAPHTPQPFVAPRGYFNNDGRAATVENARRLTELLAGRPARRHAA